VETNIKITFWINRTKKNSKNLVPVYLRVAHNYDKFSRATGIRIPAADWDKKAMRIKGISPEAITANATLDSLKVKVIQIVNQLNEGGKLYNLPDLTCVSCPTEELVLVLVLLSGAVLLVFQHHCANV